MKEHPILFSTEMVQAILAGRKTMTRRVVKDIQNAWKDGTTLYAEDRDYLTCPYGRPGERLWVRETWYCENESTAQDIMSRYEGLYYKATEKHPEIFPKWKPSIFMPRWASRITLEITDVRVERLQEISGIDAVKEGCGQKYASCDLIHYGGYKKAKEEFANLWDSINGKKYPWESNPWVWVIEYRRIDE